MNMETMAENQTMEFDEMMKEIYKEIKSRQRISLRWVKKFFWPSAGELSPIEKKLMINIYTGDLADKDFLMRFKMSEKKMMAMKKKIKEKIKQFILRQTPIDKLFYETFKKQYIMANKMMMKRPSM